MALGFAAEVGQRLVGQVGTHIEDFGFDEAFLNDTLGQPQVRAAIRDGARESRFRTIGQTVLATKGVNHSWLESDIAAMTRDSVRQFAKSEVAPIAERVHRNDELIPESVNQKHVRTGLFRHVGTRRVRWRRHGAIWP